jgi:hypothetical protein
MNTNKLKELIVRFGFEDIKSTDDDYDYYVRLLIKKNGLTRKGWIKESNNTEYLSDYSDVCAVFTEVYQNATIDDVDAQDSGKNYFENGIKLSFPDDDYCLVISKPDK